MLLHTNEPFGSLQADQGTCGVNRRGTRFSITSQNVESNDTIPSALLQVELADPLFDLSLSQKASRQFVCFPLRAACGLKAQDGQRVSPCSIHAPNHYHYIYINCNGRVSREKAEFVTVT